MDIVTPILFVLGLVLLVKGADVLVQGASGLARNMGVSVLVIGLTVVAFGTSAPELAVGVRAGLFGAAGQTDIALGNVLGSNIANILLILGLAATISPLVIQQQLLRFDLPLMLAVSFLLLFLCLDGSISQFDGLILFLGIIAYTTWSIIQSRRQEASNHAALAQAEDAAEVAEVAEVAEEASPQWQRNGGYMALGLLLLTLSSGWLVRRAAALVQAIGVNETAIQAVIAKSEQAAEEVSHKWYINAGFMVVGLLMLTFGSDWLVQGASAFARAIGVSEMVIGLTIVAIGTSLPEIAATTAAGLKGETDMAVGNVIGSNIFNILSVLGLTSLITPGGLPVSDGALQYDFPLMLAVSVLCWPVFLSERSISRSEGILFLTYYAMFLIYIVLDATGHSLLGPFTLLMTLLLPTSLGWLVLVTARSMIEERERRT